ncbi:uncharacterized protein LOC117650820 [Thrips palmi]|uniref:Uncharacterized protein LOC117650820 n=1 Tax=Thrips palmi TaxID=161013 RepID=A0A6P8ZYV7_THRPL|nr:uncharacterized protein LOC117650820 [Thrips palmi]
MNSFAAFAVFLCCIAYGQANYLTDFDRAMEHCSHTPLNNANFQAVRRCAPSLSNRATFNLCLNGLNAEAKKIVNAGLLACLDKYITALKGAGGSSDQKKGRLAASGGGNKRARGGGK